MFWVFQVDVLRIRSYGILHPGFHHHLVGKMFVIFSNHRTSNSKIGFSCFCSIRIKRIEGGLAKGNVQFYEFQKMTQSLSLKRDHCKRKGLESSNHPFFRGHVSFRRSKSQNYFQMMRISKVKAMVNHMWFPEFLYYLSLLFKLTKG